MPRLIHAWPAVLALAPQVSAQELVFDDSSLFFDDATPAEEFTLDDGALVFDEGSLDAVSAEPTTEPDRRGPDWELSYAHSLTSTMGIHLRDSALSLTASNSGTYDGIGFVEWQVSITADDLHGTSDASVDLDKLIIQNSFGDFSVKAGKYPIGWGEVEGVPVLDVLNAGLSLDDLGAATDDLPGQWFVSLDHFGQTFTTSAFVNLDPAVSHGATTAVQGADLEAGVKVSLPTGTGQVSAYAARLLPQAGVVDYTSTTSSAQAYTLIGASGHHAAGAVLLEADLAAKLDLQRATATGYATDDRLDLALGAEWAASATTQLTGSVAVQHWLDDAPGYFDVGLAGPVAAQQTNASYLLSANKSSSDASLDLSAFLGGAADGSSSFLALQAGWAPSDRISYSASWSKLSAQSGSLLAPLDGTTSLSVELTYRF